MNTTSFLKRKHLNGIQPLWILWIALAGCLQIPIRANTTQQRWHDCVSSSVCSWGARRGWVRRQHSAASSAWWAAWLTCWFPSVHFVLHQVWNTELHLCDRRCHSSSKTCYWFTQIDFNMDSASRGAAMSELKFFC